MKKIIFLTMAIIGCLFCCYSCSDDDWDYDHSLENVYYFGPEVWGYDSTKKGNNNVVHYEVKQGETVEIPMQFWCEFERSYDVVTYYYVSGDLVRGRDYEVVDGNGQSLSPDSNGAFTLTWPNAKKGVQNIYIKALNGEKGSFQVQTFDPNSTVTLSNQDVSSTVQSKADDYEVRIFTQNYKVKVTIQ